MSRDYTAGYMLFVHIELEAADDPIVEDVLGWMKTRPVIVYLVLITWMCIIVMLFLVVRPTVPNNAKSNVLPDDPARNIARDRHED